MGKQVGRWIIASLGYLLYTLVVLAVCLWLMFPHASLHRLLVRALDAAFAPVQWQVGSLDFALPPSVRLEEIEGRDRKNGQPSLTRIDSLTIMPDLKVLLRERRLKAGFRLQVAKGTVAGELTMAKPTSDLLIRGSLQDIRLPELGGMARSLQRDLQGVADGSFDGTVRLKPFALREIQAKMRVRDGSLELKQPVLGHTVLPFAQVSAALALREGRLQVTDGRVESSLGVGTFTGEVGLKRAWAASLLNVTGSVQPRAELFKSFAANPLVLQAIRQRLRDRPLPFRLSGELAAPAIPFEEFAVLLQSLNAEKKK